ncbi:molybdopterin-dependent oxidoreductase [Longirhabdus pacifica]|uniref:molybdopterin-dependent oxidoreductase n=1 Tax=Longirhabdus pacifica TaxID=2305227 RepID=UPI001008A6F5|nr:molybdopterin-dependent oxidoreductase [Longirhabdus pacifica]
MERKKWIWKSLAFGKKLISLHRWNAWTILALTITGIVLFTPVMRELGVIRSVIKQAHVIFGIVSILLLLLYLPLLKKHVKQIRRKYAQWINLIIVLFLIIGWSVSGIILWQYRQFPPSWVNGALLWHDILTWIGVPYIIYHSITRLRWVKKQAKRTIIDKVDNLKLQELKNKEIVEVRHQNPPPISRRSFIKISVVSVLLLAIGPYFYRWLKQATDTGGEKLAEYWVNDRNNMLPPPNPQIDSQKVIGGGAKGNFRIYTVTEIPQFDSVGWTFTIGGLVGQSIQYNWNEFLKLPRVVQVSDFHCVTGWSVYQCTWEGITLSDLLDTLSIDKRAKYVKFISGDGVYTDTLTLEQAAMKDVMLAVLLDGKPLPQKLGGPVRLVVPKMYAYKSVKWVQSIELIENEHDGYWEQRGYSKDAWV